MRALRLICHEAWHEFRYGVRSGIVSLTFVGMIGYLLLVLTSGDEIQKLGATDVPRNGAVLIYLMATGCMFFLFFALAWVYAQPCFAIARHPCMRWCWQLRTLFPHCFGAGLSALRSWERF